MLRTNKTNILLQKDDVGLPKPPCRDLPSFGHTYGLAGARDQEGVAALTSKWTAHAVTSNPKYEKDFKQTNKISLKKRATTARAQSAFRRTFTNGLPRLQQHGKEARLYLPEEQFMYGKPNRPSTPVGDVISNYYGAEALKNLEQKYNILRETTKPLGLSFARGHTKASAMAHNFVTQQSQAKELTLDHGKLFKMKKFQNVAPRTNTYAKFIKV